MDDKSYEGGYIKLYRKMTRWEWYDDINTKVLFFHLLLTVNWEDRQWHGITVKRGQIVTSLEKLAKETRLTVQNVRTAINKLKSTGEITVETTNKYTLVTVEMYSVYQVNEGVTNNQINTQANNPLTNNQQTTNKQLTTNEEYKEVKKDKNNIYLQDCNTIFEGEKKTTNKLQGFDTFWEAYPKHKGKDAAKKAFAKINPTESLLKEILTAVEAQKKTHEWQKDNGQYIPYPATWLNGKRWEDDKDGTPMSLEELMKGL